MPTDAGYEISCYLLFQRKKRIVTCWCVFSTPLLQIILVQIFVRKIFGGQQTHFIVSDSEMHTCTIA